MNEFQDVRDFHEKFDLLPEGKGPLTKGMARKRADQMREELREFEDACADDDTVKAVDALVDSVYFALGSLIQMGVSAEAWRGCWYRVHVANMAKQRLPELAGSLKHGIVKPAGWQSPEPLIAEHLRADGFKTNGL